MPPRCDARDLVTFGKPSAAADDKYFIFTPTACSSIYHRFCDSFIHDGIQNNSGLSSGVELS